MREYAYDANGNQTHSVLYAGTVDVSRLVGPDGAPLALDPAELRPEANAADLHEWRTWDAAGRQVHQIDGSGKTTQTSYDGAGRVLSVTVYATPLDTASLGAILTPSMVPVRSASGDRTIRNFYDGDGLASAKLDADGKLVQYFRDGAGNVTEERAYAIEVNPALRANGTLAQMTVGLKTDDDIRTMIKYDGTGARLSSSIVQGYPEDAIPGVHEIAGTISQPGERDAYEFTLTEKSRLFFDGVQGDLTQWSLTTGSASIFSSRDLTATGDRFLELGVGTYRLTVDGVGDRTGNYSFRLLGEEAAQPLTVNQATAGSLQPAAQGVLYQVNAQAGDRLFLQTNGSSSPLRYSVFGPDGRVLRDNGGWSDSGVLVADRSGTYWVSIEATATATAPLAYNFTLFRSTPQSQALVAGDTVRADMATPGAVSYYDIDVSEAGWLRWDQLSGYNSPVRWTLYSPNGVQLTQVYCDSDDASRVPVAVGAGRYRLAVEAVSRQPAPLDFRMTMVARSSVVDLASGQSIAIDAPTGREDRVYKMHVDGATTLALRTAIATSGQTVHMQVVNPNGGVVSYDYSIGNNAVRQFSLPAEGDYYVFVGGSLGNSGPLKATVTANTWVSKAT
jgi:YD repeat-containing protein